MNLHLDISRISSIFAANTYAKNMPLLLTRRIVSRSGVSFMQIDDNTQITTSERRGIYRVGRLFTLLDFREMPSKHSYQQSQENVNFLHPSEK